MTLFIIVLSLSFVTLLLINLVVKNDTKRNTELINSIIFKIIEEEDKDTFVADNFKNKILEKCKEIDLEINDLICDLKYNKLTIKYSYKNLNRLSNNEIECDV